MNATTFSGVISVGSVLCARQYWLSTDALPRHVDGAHISLTKAEN